MFRHCQQENLLRLCDCVIFTFLILQLSERSGAWRELITFAWRLDAAAGPKFSAHINNPYAALLDSGVGGCSFVRCILTPTCPHTSTYSSSRAVIGSVSVATLTYSQLSPACDLGLPPHVPQVTHVRAPWALYLLLSAISSSLDAEQQPWPVQKGIALPEPLCQSTLSEGFLGLRQEPSVPLRSRQGSYFSYAAHTCTHSLSVMGDILNLAGGRILAGYSCTIQDSSGLSRTSFAARNDFPVGTTGIAMVQSKVVGIGTCWNL